MEVTFALKSENRGASQTKMSIGSIIDKGNRKFRLEAEHW